MRPSQSPDHLRRQTLRAGTFALGLIGVIVLVGWTLADFGLKRTNESRLMLELVTEQQRQAERLAVLIQRASVAQNPTTRTFATEALNEGLNASDALNQQIKERDRWGPLDAYSVEALRNAYTRAPLNVDDRYHEMMDNARTVASRVQNGERVDAQLYRAARLSVTAFEEAQAQLIEIYRDQKVSILYQSRLRVLLVFGTLFLSLVVIWIGMLRPFSHRIKRQAEAIDQVNQRLATAAVQDALTGLPNRTFSNRFLEDELKAAGRVGTSLAVAHIDLDHFKEINDTHGHAAGDRLLVVFAERMQNAIEKGQIVARVGGDEFIMILPGQDNGPALRRQLKSVLSDLAKPVDFEGVRLRAGASIGVTIYPNDGVDPAELIVNADLALYDVKQHGRGSYRFFNQDMRHELTLRQRLEVELRMALEDGAFEPYMQPQVNARTGALIGLECLVRWDHPVRGRITPGEFLPVAESAGVMVRLGRQVAEKAIAQAADWKRRGIGFGRLAINASAQELREEDFADWILATAKKHGLPGTSLSVEILETVMMNDAHIQLPEKLGHLRANGVLIELDDFGTGYASLQQVKPDAIDRLKIDRVFISGIETNTKNKMIVQAMVNLSESLGIEILAEGAETHDEIETLLSIGCEAIQGFGIARPMPVSAIEEWIQDNALQNGLIDLEDEADARRNSA